MTAGMGFDDNILQTPTDGGGTDDVVLRQVVRPEVTEISTLVSRQVPTGKFTVNNNVFVPIFRTVTQKVILRPAQEEQVIVQRFPGTPDRDRESSVISSLDASYQAQWSKGRKAFTMDARAGSRSDGDSNDPTGSFRWRVTPWARNSACSHAAISGSSGAMT